MVCETLKGDSSNAVDVRLIYQKTLFWFCRKGQWPRYIKTHIKELFYDTLLDFGGKWYSDVFWSELVRFERCLEIVLTL